MPCALDPLPSSAGLSRQRPDIATFAQSFTTKELTFTRATGESRHLRPNKATRGSAAIQNPCIQYP